MQTNAKILSIQTGNEPESKGYKKVIIELSHSNETTTLKQNLILRCHPFSNEWEAKIEIVDFPGGLKFTEAALKLGEWLTRIGRAVTAEIETIMKET